MVYSTWFRAGKILARCRGVGARWKGLNFLFRRYFGVFKSKLSAVESSFIIFIK